ncbi:hypothetical protein [Novosphingobium resinovorum]|uniref:Uncharacterized protein n=1 Tax=Novosphingobium resinovorum TaxID=158500 RepID=A0A1D8A517_9SPHN|nr:hypothetical protein [Novosphingobium resinovorum]AOR77204.1 hypothetical protein BES08_10920 [Novosphingobium resinovorum]
MVGDDRLSEIPTPAPTLEGLEQVVALAEKRRRRARKKMAALEAEIIAADAAHERAVAARTEWIANSRDPQMMMF